MSSTTPTNVDVNIPEIWAKKVLADHLYAGFWAGKIGAEGSGAPIIQKSELLNSPGDTIHITTSAPLTGSGVSGDLTALEGSEENLTLSEMVVVPVQYRHAVRTYRRAQKKSLLDLRTEAQSRLAEWGGQKMDTVRMANFVASGTLNGQTYTPNAYAVGGPTTGAVPGDVGTSDTLTVAALQSIKLSLYNNRATPLSDGAGRSVFGMLVHPNTLFALKRETEYQSWVRDALVRGEDNPFFRGSTAMIDGIVLFEHPNVVTASDGGSSNLVSRNIAFGAEAFVEGVDEGVSWYEKSFDYDNEFGIAYRFAFQPRRGLEKNSLLVYAAATAA